MHIRSLKHIVQAVDALVHPDQIIVMGSSSLLAHDTLLGEPGQPLELSLDADLLLDPTDEAQAGVLHEAIGEGSLFHREYGVYADLLRPQIEETLPPGWRERCKAIEGVDRVVCLDPYDLAVVKLCVGRDKDVELLQGLLARGLIDLDKLRARYQATPMDERLMFRSGRVLSRLS
ncbi:MAG: hypothetical protein HQ523_11820 [Lentisphaerae bacterium]|nr:hypothetical protein [Lentisphaerota bacterium]